MERDRQAARGERQRERESEREREREGGEIGGGRLGGKASRSLQRHAALSNHSGLILLSSIPVTD